MAYSITEVVARRIIAILSRKIEINQVAIQPIWISCSSLLSWDSCSSSYLLSSSSSYLLSSSSFSFFIALRLARRDRTSESSILIENSRLESRLGFHRLESRPAIRQADNCNKADNGVQATRQTTVCRQQGRQRCAGCLYYAYAWHVSTN